MKQGKEMDSNPLKLEVSTECCVDVYEELLVVVTFECSIKLWLSDYLEYS